MNPLDSELTARLHVWRASGIGPATFQHLLAYFASIRHALDASNAELAKAGCKPAVIQALRELPENAAEPDLRWLEQVEHRHILISDDEHYPTLLRNTSSAPPVLFVAGNPTLLNDPQLAIVGSRNPSRAGQENAHAFAHYLAERGLCITSGLAIGIDTQSHQGALDAQGSTIAVIGTGLDIVYPARNRNLAERIVAQGAIVSEFPIGVKPQAQNFPRRNRLISGMSLGTLVVEATLQSGSLVTARHAMEQGREVFAIPGSIHNPMARGCHQLIRQGAKLVETAMDILEEMAPQLQAFLQGDSLSELTQSTDRPASLKRNENNTNDTASVTTHDKTHDTGGHWPREPLDDDELNLLAALGHDPVPIDQLVLQTGLTTEAVSSMLLMLELQGQVSACGGGHYMRLHTRD